MKTRLLLPILGLAMCGCVQTRISAPSYTFESTRFFWPGKVDKVAITGTNATMQGYHSQSDPAAIAEAVARGLASGLKP